MTDRALLQQALEALDGWNHVLDPKPDANLITALRERLAQPEWVGLTRDEVLDIEETAKHPLEFARAIEAKLKEKNT